MRPLVDTKPSGTSVAVSLCQASARVARRSVPVYSAQAKPAASATIRSVAAAILGLARRRVAPGPPILGAGDGVGGTPLLARCSVTAGGWEALTDGSWVVVVMSISFGRSE